jgi:hypothetical protein
MRWLKRLTAGRVILAAAGLTLAALVLWVGLITLVWAALGRPASGASDLWSMLEGLSSAAAFAVVIGGGIVVLEQLVESVDSRHLSVYNDVFRDMMSDAEIEARRWIYLHLPDDPEQGIAALGPEGQRHVKLVLNSFDHLGFLLRQGWISDEALIEWVSPIVVKTWARLGPYVRYECQRRGEPYYYSAAQYLADRCTEWWRRNRPNETITWIKDAL